MQRTAFGTTQQKEEPEPAERRLHYVQNDTEERCSELHSARHSRKKNRSLRAGGFTTFRMTRQKEVFGPH